MYYLTGQGYLSGHVFWGNSMKAAIITAAALTLAAAGGIVTFLLMRCAEVPDPSAEIRVNGEIVRTVPLSEDCEFTVTTPEGHNVIRVADGMVSVVEADCPDKVCVNTKPISGGLVPIICLPHHLEIVIVSAPDTSADAAAY